MYNSFNLHSIVAYNVGYHYDVFNQGLASLDKIVVFSLPGNHGEGRSGYSKFCRLCSVGLGSINL